MNFDLIKRWVILLFAQRIFKSNTGYIFFNPIKGLLILVSPCCFSADSLCDIQVGCELPGKTARDCSMMPEMELTDLLSCS